jgi:hypothetical protein
MEVHLVWGSSRYWHLVGDWHSQLVWGWLCCGSRLPVDLGLICWLVAGAGAIATDSTVRLLQSGDSLVLLW